MKPHLYVKKPIPVEAYQWNGTHPFNPAPGFEPEISGVVEWGKMAGVLSTAEGPMRLVEGSFIVKDPAGEYWVDREDIFINTYSAIPQN